ncbi:MAG: carbohydrate-binding domain-containing protein [Clostridia bacterium]|nr:carbohydrate-binding domain-containing protein [Clostridia bacterium]
MKTSIKIDGLFGTKKLWITGAAVLLTAALLTTALAGCSAPRGNGGELNENVTTQRVVQTPATDTGTDPLADPAREEGAVTGDFVLTDESGAAVAPKGGVYTITAAGNYMATGVLTGGQIVVDLAAAGDEDEVKLILSGASITNAANSAGAAVTALTASKLTVEAKEGTYNEIIDVRSAASGSASGAGAGTSTGAGTESGAGTATDDEIDDENGAIYAACDLKLSGKGTLIVTTSYDNGIKSKDDLTVKNLTLKVTAPGVALKGNDSVKLESGSLILISTGGDGVKTSSSDISAKGNQRGTVTVSGGQVDIYAAKDGISAAYDAVIGEGAKVNIFTASYSDYSGGAAATGSKLYLIVPRSSYSASNDYYAYFYNAGGAGAASDPVNGSVPVSGTGASGSGANGSVPVSGTGANGSVPVSDEGSLPAGGVLVKCTYETMVYSGRSASYYGLSLKAPQGYGSVKFFVVKSGVVPDGSNHTASTSGGSVNTSMNAYLISSISGGSISGDWTALTTSTPGKSGKTAYSAKGIKAANEVRIDGGSVTVSSGDDGIHANGGDELENGAKGAGSVIINAGSVTITAADDGIHADGTLTVAGGSVNVVKAYEGLEGNVINIAGGSVFVYAQDDGLNACRGAATPLVNITGGYLDVTTQSGDTDGVDSNGNITISGGFTIVKGGSSQGGMAGSVDVDGSIKMTGGTVVALGGICETPSASGSSVNTYVSTGSVFEKGTYSLKDAAGNEILSFSLAAPYYSIWIASDGLTLNGEYSLVAGDGVALLSWKQSSSTVGASGSGWGNPGGPGGWGGGSHGGPGGGGHGGRP